MNILNLIKSLDIEKQRDFNEDDLSSNKNYSKQQIKKELETYNKLGILEKNEKGNYRIKNMCMLSQF